MNHLTIMIISTVFLKNPHASFSAENVIQTHSNFEQEISNLKIYLGSCPNTRTEENYS